MQTVTEDSSVEDRLLVLTRPVEAGPWPGVVMIHEAWGIDDVLRRQAERLASAGFVVLAPDLLGEGRWIGCIRRTMAAYTARQGRPFELIESCRQQLVHDPGCTGNVGVIGFCMGGGFALLVAGRGFDVSAVNYGQVPEDVDQVLAGACPIVASYGGKDKRTTAGVPRLTAALDTLGIPHDVKVYPDASHSFLNDAVNGPKVLRPLIKIAGVGPEPASAADAWRRIESFFAEHLT